MPRARFVILENVVREGGQRGDADVIWSDSVAVGVVCMVCWQCGPMVPSDVGRTRDHADASLLQDDLQVADARQIGL